jgi:hypothetical protein
MGRIQLRSGWRTLVPLHSERRRLTLEFLCRVPTEGHVTKCGHAKCDFVTLACFLEPRQRPWRLTVAFHSSYPQRYPQPLTYRVLFGALRSAASMIRPKVFEDWGSSAVTKLMTKCHGTKTSSPLPPGGAIHTPAG